MSKNKKTHKEASSENYFALKSGYVQHTSPIQLNTDSERTIEFWKRHQTWIMALFG
ncbi:MAG: hypothetical protein OEZ21_11335 [Candidatus Bathyarchaeota archaeon]|nr:hypothetical protein [Candidatus Bathyarchaeota archaeon]